MIHFSLHERGDLAELRCQGEEEQAFQKRLVPLEELAALVARVEGLRAADGEDAAVAAGRELYAWLDGPESWFPPRLEGLKRKGPRTEPAPIYLHLPGRAAALPWETLHDGGGFLADRLDPPLAVVRWRPARHPPAFPANRPLNVLFMAACPQGGPSEPSLETIEARMLAAVASLPLHLEMEDSGSLLGLGDLVRDGEAGGWDVVHLAAWADARDGTPRLLLESDQGRPHGVSAQELAREVSLKPRLLVLSAGPGASRAGAAETQLVAEELVRRGFPAVLSWRRPASDSEAAEALSAFYERLAFGRSLLGATAHACALLRKRKSNSWQDFRLFAACPPVDGLVTPLSAPGRRGPLQGTASGTFLDPSGEAGAADRRGFVGRRRMVQRLLGVLRSDSSDGVGGAPGGTRPGSEGTAMLGNPSGAPGISASLSRPFGGGSAGLAVGVFSAAAFPGTAAALAPASAGGPAAWAVGLFGPSGAGRTSLVRKLCDRVGERFEAVLHRGALDEASFLRALEPHLRTSHERRLLQADPAELSARLVRWFQIRREAGGKKLLFVFDDFEKNGAAEHAHLRLEPPPERVLAAVARAVELAPDEARGLIAGRWRLSAAAAGGVLQEPLSGLRGADLAKKLLAIEPPSAPGRPPALLPALRDAAVRAAEGNPRLLERLFDVLKRPQLEHSEILRRLEEYDLEYREPLLAESLLATLTPAARQVLAGLLFFRAAVPFAALQGMFADRSEMDLHAALAAAAALGLVQREEDPEGPLLQAPRLLELLLGRDLPAEPAVLTGRAAATLFPLWWRLEEPVPEARLSELFRLTLAARWPDAVAEVALRLGIVWGRLGRVREAAFLWEAAVAAAPGRTSLIVGLASLKAHLGDGVSAERLVQEAILSVDLPDQRRAVARQNLARAFQEGVPLSEALAIGERDLVPAAKRRAATRARAVALGQAAAALVDRGDLDEALFVLRDDLVPTLERLGDNRSRATALGQEADVLLQQGELDAALRVRRDEQIPIYDRIGDLKSRAAALGKSAEILYQKGELDEALRLVRDEQIPTLVKLGDPRAHAAALGQLADVLVQKGELDEALRVRWQEQLPAFERMGDLRGWAAAVGQAADVLVQKGEMNEAVRILREGRIPAYERLGDARGWAAAVGHLADVLVEKGELDEALRIRREQEVPAYERLGAEPERAAALVKTADALARKGELDEALRIIRGDLRPAYERLGDARGRAAAAGQEADVLARKGELDEAYRIRREVQIPALERLGAARDAALALGCAADLLAQRGDLEESIRVRHCEQIPTLERLGAVRERAAALGSLADVLVQKGELEDALRIRRQEQIPAFERLGAVRETAVALGKCASILMRLGRIDEALRLRMEVQIPAFERLGDVRERAVALGKAADLLALKGEVDEALRIRLREQIPVFERLGAVRERAVALGRAADLLLRKGEVDEALRIFMSELLPVFERLGDVRSRATTLGRAADVLARKGALDEALRIRRLEQIPVFERLGDVRARSAALGKVADLLMQKGELDETLRILRDEALPPLVAIGDLHGAAQISVKAALVLIHLGRGPEALPYLREAEGTFERFGDEKSLVRMRRLLEAASDPAEPPWRIA